MIVTEIVTAHPNRSRRLDRRNPSPVEIRQARERSGLTQTEAAALIYCTLRGWQEWEAGNRSMHPAFWELWRLKGLSGKRIPEIYKPSALPHTR